MPKLNDEELISAIEAQEASSLDSWSGILAGDRAEALARYRGEPDGTEIEGRSQIVSRDLLDQIEWIMPSLARIFLSGDEVGKFAPLGPQDETQAEIETAACNWYLMQRNDGFTQLMAAMRDALLLRNGYCLAWWRKETFKEQERYSGLTGEELALVLQDKSVKVVEQEERLDPELGPVFDIVVEREKEDEWVNIEAIPPDEIRVSRRHRMGSLEDCDFVQWRHETTIGELRALGYDVEDEAPEAEDTPLEATYRNRFDESQMPNEESRDPSRRRVICKENWMRIDLEDTGKPQLWRCAYIDGTKRLMIREKADIIPVAAFTAIGYPHSHVGTSFHDLISDLAQVKQALLRQLLDNVYINNNGRTAVDINRVNVDDLLVSRPGGVVRVDGNLGDAMLPLPSADLTGGVMGALQYVDQLKETRTGVSKASAGLDANSLNKTATGVQMLQSAGRERIELIARTLAGGFVDLFRIIHRLVSKHSTKPLQLQINGKWMEIDPRSWAKRTQFSIAVGMGTGTPEAQMAKLQSVAQFMGQGVPMGLVGPEEFRNWAAEYLKAAGYRNVEKFVKEPQKDPQTGQAVMPPPKPDPMVQAAQIKAQADVQGKQFDAQSRGQELQAKSAADVQAMQLDAQLKREAAQNALELQRSNDERQAQLELQKLALDRERMAMEFDFKRWQVEYEAQVKLQVAQIQTAAKAQAQQTEATQ